MVLSRASPCLPIAGMSGDGPQNQLSAQICLFLEPGTSSKGCQCIQPPAPPVSPLLGFHIMQYTVAGMPSGLQPSWPFCPGKPSAASPTSCTHPSEEGPSPSRHLEMEMCSPTSCRHSYLAASHRPICISQTSILIQWPSGNSLCFAYQVSHLSRRD